MRLRKQRGSRPMTFEAFGVSLELTLGDESLGPAVQAILPPGWAPSDAAQPAGRFGLRQTDADQYEVTVDGEPWLKHQALDVALDLLDAQMRMMIAANARNWTFVHAGVVAIGDAALMIPGQSFFGKTSLVVALVQAGATYLSDEYAVLDADGRVHPYARRLSVRGDDQSVREHDVEELGGVAGEVSLGLGAVLITRYRAHAEWRPVRVSRGEGLLVLMANTVPAQERPHQSLQVLSRALAGSVVLKSDRGEARTVAPKLLDELAALTPP